MSQDPQSEFIKDRLAGLPPELVKLMVSPELPRKIELLAKKYSLDETQEIVLQNEISFLLLVIASLDELPIHLEEGLVVTLENADLISQDVRDYILKSVDQYLAHNRNELIVSDEPGEIPQTSGPFSTQTLEDPITPSKEKILQEIENPSRTSIKRYAIEYDHKPLQDSTHLLDDKVDDVIKIEERYND